QRGQHLLPALPEWLARGRPGNHRQRRSAALARLSIPRRLRSGAAALTCCVAALRQGFPRGRGAASRPVRLGFRSAEAETRGRIRGQWRRMRPIITALVLMLLSAAGLVEAGTLYRCEGRDGETVYSTERSGYSNCKRLGNYDAPRSPAPAAAPAAGDRKSTRLNSSHVKISYAVFCLKK